MCDAKAYLKKIKLADRQIDRLIDNAARIQAKATKMTSIISPVVVTKSSNPYQMEDSSIELVELKKEINAEIDRYVDFQRKVNDIINQLDDPDHVDVLNKRYFEYKPWEQIACEMGYSYRNVCYIHGKALQAFESLMEGVS